MPTNLAIDDNLINEAVSIGGHRTKRAAVNCALEEYIQHHKQKKIVEIFGSIDYEPEYDYKKNRARNERKIKK